MLGLFKNVGDQSIPRFRLVLHDFTHLFPYQMEWGLLTRIWPFVYTLRIATTFCNPVSDSHTVAIQFAAIPSPLSEADGYHIHPEKIAEEISRGTSVILTSNPRNPTGQVVKNPELAEIQDIARGETSTSWL